MSRFDELTPLFNVWRKDWLDQYSQHQLIPPRIAKKFQEFLGCPASFKDLSGQKEIEYVSPTRAEWNNNSQEFKLSIYKQFIEDVDFKDDGYFYFGMRVFLELGPQTYPKQDFWFTLRGKQEENRLFYVSVMPSQQEFILDPDANGQITSLCEHLFERLKENLAATPLSRMTKEPYQIGFNPPQNT